MDNLRQTTAPFEATLSIDKPTLLEFGKAKNVCVQFTVTLNVGDTPLGSVPGWRVWRGALHAPARKGGNNWYPTFVIEHERLTKLLISMVSQWEESFPEVQFPTLLSS